MAIRYIPKQSKGFTYVQDNEPLAPQQGDSWFDTGTPSAVYFRVNNVWVRLGIEV